MINKDKISELIKSEWWQEFKKLLKQRKIELAMRLVDNPSPENEKERIKIKTIEEMILIPENIFKKEQIKKRELNSLWNIPASM